MIRVLAVAAALAGAAVAAEAKPARCATTDDGAFACAFRPTDDGGSFEITSPGKPGYALEIVEPGVAFGFVTIDGRSVPLPGRYLRSRVDGACWINDTTGARICAW